MAPELDSFVPKEPSPVDDLREWQVELSVQSTIVRRRPPWHAFVVTQLVTHPKPRVA
ncbi:hypothetical protein [Micromonospora sp. NPDC049274]|uniref:hypothetical protein n=1 Tax=Micromonospora sp. NPDC049274 TaxID=3154829 RepID=UPI0034348FB8